VHGISLPRSPFRFRQSPLSVLARSAVFAAVVLGWSACGGVAPAPESTPNKAAADLAAILLVDPPTQTCLTTKLNEQPNVAAALNREPTNKPTGAQIDALKVVLRSCISAEAEADLYAKISRETFPRAPQSAIDCLRGKVLALSDAEQDTLLMGAVNPEREGLAYATLMSGSLLQPCELDRYLDSPGGEQVGPKGTATGPVRDAEGSGTVVTR